MATRADNKETKDPSKDAAKDVTKDPQWTHINTDLKHALDTWSELTEQLADKLSPEETQLQEIKTLLGTLKDKLKEFNEDPK
jgi:hypothetical protein